jgi:RNA polymerase sigma factor (sigma-70 family)
MSLLGRRAYLTGRRRLWFDVIATRVRPREPRRLRSRSVDNTDLLDRVGRGDQDAWDELVAQFAGLVWSVARSYRLGRAATDDVVQTVWLRLAEHCGRIREPDRLAAWLATTTRNESLRVIRQSARIAGGLDSQLVDMSEPTTPSVDDRVVDLDDRAQVAAAFRQLSADDQMLLRLLCAVPPLDYETIADIIGRPIGSIGPTRARCLGRLRRLLAGATGQKDGNAS